MKRLPMLLLGHAAIAACLVGGCSSRVTTAIAKHDPAPAGEDKARLARDQPPATGSRTTAPVAPGEIVGKSAPFEGKGDIVQQFASAALDDGRLGTIRGGLDTGSGVQLNFAFQQATYLNHNLVQTVVVPTLTVSRDMTTSLGGSPAITTAAGAPFAVNTPVVPSLSAASNLSTKAIPATVNVTSPSGLGISGPSLVSASGGGNATTVISSGSQVQTSSLVPGVQSLGGNGTTSVATTLGAGGLTNVVSNTANNQLIQQVTTLDIGVSGLSKLLQQGVSSSVMTRLTSGASSFR